MKLKLAGVRAMLTSLAGIGLVTLICFRVLHAPATTASLLLLLAVLVTAVSTRLVFAMIAAFVGTFCLDYYFLPPVGSITIADPQNWVALLVFCAVCLIAGQLSSQLRSQRDELIDQQRESERLHLLSRSLLMHGSGEDMRRLIVNQCTKLFDLDDFVLFETAHQSYYRSNTTKAFPQEHLQTVTELCKMDLNGVEWTLMPVSFGNVKFGGLGLTRKTPLPPATIAALASTIALAQAQAQAQETASRVQAERRSEELKSVMIDALAHDLKTPLTSIEAAADILAGPGPLSPTQAAEMVMVIQEESDGLRRLVNEAIHLARINAKRIKLNLKAEPVLGLVESAIQLLGERAGHTLEIEVPSSVSPVLVDNELMVQALKQLVDNALKYGPPRSRVSVRGHEVDGLVTISVRDSGPGLTELEQSRVFDKFYRGRYDQSVIQGTGMGLSIAREIVEAHGGSVGVRSYLGQGTEFFITLKATRLTALSPQMANV